MIIEAKDIRFSYTVDGDIKTQNAVDGIPLSIDKGEFVALLGHNGSGKSTLAKLFNGLLLPTSGVLTVNGVDTRDADKIYELRKCVGMVFQNPDNQMVASIVEDDVAFGPENLGVPQSEVAERVEWALKSVGMYEHRNRTAHKMSGGQKQRIAIAGALALKPQVLVLDESTAMLDPSGRREVMNTISELREKDGMTVILITHFMDEVMAADRVFVLNDGKVAMSGSPCEIFSRQEELRAIGLDVPRAVLIASQLRKADLDIGDDVMTVEALGERICQLL